MSSKNNRQPEVPQHWLGCPNEAIIRGKFLAFKTPLSSVYNSQVSEERRFTVDTVFANLKRQKRKMGLWIDLTNTTRYYDKDSIKDYDCEYKKLRCRGHDETPSVEQTRDFVRLCSNFIARNPQEIIGVHCTHGFNRTGFLIISYLVEIDGNSVADGIAEFATARPHGIYKDFYIKELYKRYDGEANAPPPPARPAWCL